MINSGALAILKYKNDKPDAAPVVYAKMYTEQKDPKKKDELKMTSVFYRKKTAKEAKKGVKGCSKNSLLVKTTGHDYIKQKCRVIGGLKIEGVYVGPQIESIQVKLTEIVIVKKVNPFQSIMGEDLDLGSDNDSESESESEDEEEVVQKPKKEVAVKRPTKKQANLDPEDEEDDDDDDDDDEDFEDDITDVLIKRKR